MTREARHIQPCAHVTTVVLDLSDCFTWSFPEFLPFCSQLYYFSSLKNFDGSNYDRPIA
ncbi:hypothetical protein [Flaviaesturariibacter amylovorans]|uniref:Uncharacterized protein n=1 Tax=Flaviaesturariibacter amylovorans TaxID=1084520 RepID=A0ABP8GDF3_9BACT